LKVPRYQTHVRLDSQSAEGFRVKVSEVTLRPDDRVTRFDGRGLKIDTLALGVSTLEGLPAWYNAPSDCCASAGTGLART
jgi:hypothetical protein